MYECTLETDATLILIAHRKKGSGTPDPRQDDENSDVIGSIRGNSGIAAKMDMVALMTQKTISLKGRNIEDTKIPIARDNNKMICLREGQTDVEGNLKYVMEMEHLKSDRQRADLLATLDGIEPEAARSRIRSYRKRNRLEDKDND
jgi:hypothetical protein